MKKYKLLKDLPLLKAGAIFTINYYGTLYYKDENSSISIIKSNQDEMKKDGTFDEWFEEVKERRVWKPKEDEEYWYTYGNGDYESDTFPDKNDGPVTKRMAEERLAIGNCFKTEEEAKKTVEKLKALRRLREAGVRFDGWTCDCYKPEIHITAVFDSKSQIDSQFQKNLDLLFIEEEG